MLRYEYDVYLSGPLTSTGDLETNKQVFAKWAAVLRAEGLTVFSPPEDEEPGLAWGDYIRKDLTQLPLCRRMVMLPDWTLSRGARLERYIALEIGMPISTLAEMYDVVAR